MRELVILGTASQVPTRRRGHNGYLLRWDGEGILFDPGEGTQRQMLLAGVAATDVTRICVTHFHGDHSLGLPGIVQRLSLDRVPHPVHAHFPAEGLEYFHRLRYATSFYEQATLVEHPIERPGVVAETDSGTLLAYPLAHVIPAYGYRLVEPDGRRMRPDLLARHGIAGPAIGRLRALGRLDGVTLDQVSEPRRGQRFAFVLDTRLCDAVFALADGVDLLVIEATFLHEDADLAHRYGHLTARQAARVAAESGVRRLVLTHFSQRYPQPERFLAEAREVFDGEIVVAEDLARVAVPKRQ
ncbi:ribonuclease Z [Rhizomonospora bruguierae]|uniref:ribonuclease Z n=1 Tax=Rhizomonospora bruguierae TaxID=1581705 RepID=UPI001BD0A205|nr:ribonuclease Z [Micromonospora sp. NBRC 107566]